MIFTFSLVLMFWPLLWLWLTVHNQDKPELYAVVGSLMLLAVILCFGWGLRLLIYSLTLPL